jgi:hypothetical protein
VQNEMVHVFRVHARRRTLICVDRLEIPFWVEFRLYGVDPVDLVESVEARVRRFIFKFDGLKFRSLGLTNMRGGDPQVRVKLEACNIKGQSHQLNGPSKRGSADRRCDFLRSVRSTRASEIPYLIINKTRNCNSV